MRKILILILAALLLLAGCGKQTSVAPSSQATQPDQPTAPQEVHTGIYMIKEQIHYNSNDVEQAHMTVTLDERSLPTTVFIDSGTDITYELEYDEAGTATAFTMTRLLYGEEQVNYAQVNQMGDIIQKKSGETVSEVAYTYDDQGRTVKKEESAGGKVISTKTWDYDDQGNMTAFSSKDQKSSYSLTYTNTYENGQLIAVESVFGNGDPEHSERYTYDDQGRLLQKEETSGSEVTTTSYTYNDAGLVATETFAVNEDVYNRMEYTYDENGCLIEKQTYSYGELQSRTVYTYAELPTTLTAAQQNLFKQLGILP